MDGWNTSFLLGLPIFRGYVSFREGSFTFSSQKKNREEFSLLTSFNRVAFHRVASAEVQQLSMGHETSWSSEDGSSISVSFLYTMPAMSKKAAVVCGDMEEFVRVQLQETKMKRCKHIVTWWWIETICFFNPYLRTEDPHTLQHCSSTFKGVFWLSTHGCYSKQGVGPRIIGKTPIIYSFNHI